MSSNSSVESTRIGSRSKTLPFHDATVSLRAVLWSATLVIAATIAAPSAATKLTRMAIGKRKDLRSILVELCFASSIPYCYIVSLSITSVLGEEFCSTNSTAL